MPAERPQSWRDPRPTPDVLRHELVMGKNIHELIGSILRGDAERLYAYHRGDLPMPVDEGLIKLYELRPFELEEAALVISPKDLLFVSGFSYVAGHIFPPLVVASKQLSGHLSLTQSTEAVMASSEETRNLFATHVRNNPLLGALVSGEISDELERNPSGIQWLEKRVREEFKNGGMELVGAQKAVAGARNLFAMFAR